MSIPAIGALGSVTGVAPTGYLTGAEPTATPSAPGADAAFGAALAGSIDTLQGMQSTSSDLALKAVTGDLDDIHDYTVASSQAKVALELTAAVRNKAVEAFTEIMRMQA